jgi:Protein SET DOMAIN GROUP 2 C-terminal
MWFKQTVYDPTASLSAERRGTLSLPDVESAYGGSRSRYGPKVCAVSASVCLWPRRGLRACRRTDGQTDRQMLVRRLAVAPEGQTGRRTDGPVQHLPSTCPPAPLLRQDRDEMINSIEKRPDAMWKTGTIWSFRNEAKIYGSPMMDAVWAGMHGGAADPMPALLARLRSAPLPFAAKAPPAVGGGGQRAPRGSRASAAAAES